ncbi:MAG: hypothetical protein IJM96_02610 [Clostridia bacterium]|nr:hypothetical protein [Clostridia bacterium]
MNKYLKNFIGGLIVLAVGVGFMWLLGGRIFDGDSRGAMKFALGVGGAFQLFIYISVIFPWGDLPGVGRASAMSQATLTFNDTKKIAEAASPMRRHRGSQEGGGFVDNLPALLLGIICIIVSRIL